MKVCALFPVPLDRPAFRRVGRGRRKFECISVDPDHKVLNFVRQPRDRCSRLCTILNNIAGRIAVATECNTIVSGRDCGRRNGGVEIVTADVATVEVVPVDSLVNVCELFPPVISIAVPPDAFDAEVAREKVLSSTRMT